ncbi:rhodanese-like domain-containing protein [Nitratifractor salsuginis]|uniref:Rhodanese domain protein n=1 Tax=Nitratifractor salsuginis (strain DSM 16511 / JCM 12458 / E9I37-1) TaxID=749222 RepID=E6X0W6_NITSE|nr:rhodanese-like domain-containing protein [Nitratifractor salsuginis]ADV46898.1 Rhodanese domain protein [Nitratifractor salsuginis DSM 16511]
MGIDLKWLEGDAVNSAQLEALLAAREAGACDFLLVDVREPYEYEEAHIPGVDLLRPTSRFQEWAGELIELSRQKPVILTCRTANRTGQVQQIMKQHGAGKLIDHRSGIMSWHGPVEGGTYGGD